MLQRCLEYLDRSGFRYTHLTNPPQKLAKAIVLVADETYGIAVVPAAGYVNLDEVKAILGAEKVRLASETELSVRFPECELGAMPPFGELFGLMVYVDCGLTFEDQIAFYAGTRGDVIQMMFEDFRELVCPVIADLRRWGTPDCEPAIR